MLEKYNANESLTVDATTIGIADMMTSVETANTGFDTLYQTRNTVEATQGPSAKQIKGGRSKNTGTNAPQ